MINLATVKAKAIAGAVLAGVVLALVFYIKHLNATIEQLNRDVGSYDQQNQQLATDLLTQQGELTKLRETMEAEAEIRGRINEERDNEIQALRNQAAEWRRLAERDPEAAGFLRADLPDAVNCRLRELFPSATPDGNGISLCGPAQGSDSGHSAAGLSGPDG